MKPWGPALCLVAVALIAPSYLKFDAEFVRTLQQWPMLRIPLAVLLFGLGIGLMLRLPTKAPVVYRYAHSASQPSVASHIFRALTALTIVVAACMAPGFLLATGGHDATSSVLVSFVLVPVSGLIGIILAWLFLWVTRPRDYRR